jgi:predicted metal-dependent hydrolase
MRSCEESPPRQLLDAIGQFNRREWFECHETLEDLWVGETGEVRDFYQGVLQVAVALHHWRNGNFGGAVSLLKGGAGYLSRVSPACQWVDVAALIAAAHKMREALTELGPERMAELDPSLVPRVEVVSNLLTVEKSPTM